MAHDRDYSAVFHLIIAAVIGASGFVRAAETDYPSTAEWIAGSISAASRDLIASLPESVRTVAVVSAAENAPGMLYGVERSLIDRGVSIQTGHSDRRSVTRLIVGVRRIETSVTGTRRKYVVGERMIQRHVDVELAAELVDQRGDTVWSGEALHSASDWVSGTMLQRDTSASLYNLEVPDDTIVNGAETALVMCSVIAVLYLFFTQ